MNQTDPPSNSDKEEAYLSTFAAGLEGDRGVWHQALADTAVNDITLIDRFRQHWRLIQEWNSTTNLTAIVDEEHAAWLHYRDSLEACFLLAGQRVVDFGSGAGFPGIVLALAMPHLHVTLVEPRRIRVAFLKAVVAKLNLKHVKVFQGKTGTRPSGLFDHAVTRATFSSNLFLSEALKWLTPEGSLICYRSANVNAWGSRHSYRIGGGSVANRLRCLDIIKASQKETPLSSTVCSTS